MSMITIASKATVGDLKHPQYEIGHYFVNLYYTSRPYHVKKMAHRLAHFISGCLGDGRKMFVGEYHPTENTEVTAGSQYLGTVEEQHDNYGVMPAHWHIELKGQARDAGFTQAEINVLNRTLAANIHHLR